MMKKLGVKVTFKKPCDRTPGFSVTLKKPKIKYTSSSLNSSTYDYFLQIIYLLITPLKAINLHENILLQKYIELIFLRIIILQCNTHLICFLFPVLLLFSDFTDIHGSFWSKPQINKLFRSFSFSGKLFNLLLIGKKLNSIFHIYLTYILCRWIVQKV